MKADAETKGDRQTADGVRFHVPGGHFAVGTIDREIL